MELEPYEYSRFKLRKREHTSKALIKRIKKKKGSFGFVAFSRYLKALRYSRLLAFIFAAISFTFITLHFIGKQIDYRQTEWTFKNVCSFHSGSLTIEPGRIYEVSWEEQEAYPVKVQINDDYLYCLNYLDQWYHVSLKSCVDAFVNTSITNHFKISVKRPTEFGLVFKYKTDLSMSILDYGFFRFMGRWLRSFADPVATVNWKVNDITDSYTNEYLLFNRDFHIIRNRSK